MNTNLPPVGYSPREFEIIANLSRKYSYNLMAANKLDFFYDVAGNIKISPRETYRFLREKEGGRQVVASKWICVTKNTNKKIYMDERKLNIQTGP